jgi:hypothetical protein
MDTPTIPQYENEKFKSTFQISDKRMPTFASDSKLPLFQEFTSQMIPD